MSGARPWPGARLPRRITYTVAFLVGGGTRFLVMAADPGPTAILIVFGLSGVLCGAINPILGVVQFARVPDDVRPMVTGVTTAAVLVGGPVGAVVAGFAVEAAGLAPALVAVGAAYLVVTLCPAVFPVWREMDARPVSEPGPVLVAAATP